MLSLLYWYIFFGRTHLFRPEAVLQVHTNSREWSSQQYGVKDALTSVIPDSAELKEAWFCSCYRSELSVQDSAGLRKCPFISWSTLFTTQKQNAKISALIFWKRSHQKLWALYNFFPKVILEDKMFLWGIFASKEMLTGTFEHVSFSAISSLVW